MKNVLVTGANKGIGFEIARQLAGKRFHVLISGRDEERVSAALNSLKKEGYSSDKLIMDVSDDVSVRNAALKLSEKKIKLDVIINNAAIALKNDRSMVSMDHGILKETINTNSYGPLRVIQAFLPLMTNPGKIINVSSTVGSMSGPVDSWSPAYGVSKTLLNAITRQLAHDLQERDISVNAVCPGWVRTDMGGQSATRPVEKGAETPVWIATELSHKVTGKFYRDKAEIKW